MAGANIAITGLLALALAAPTALAAPASRDEPLLSRLNLSHSGAPVEVSSDRLEFAYEERLLTYIGSVVVRQDDIELRTDKLTIALEGVEDLRLRSVVAEGNVVLIQGQRRATGGRAVFDERAQTVVLSLGAVLQDGPNQVSGESIVVDLGLERSIVQGGEGRVRAVLYPPTRAADAGVASGAAESADE